MHMIKSSRSVSFSFCLALVATSSGSIAATTVDTEIFTGGAFDKRVKGPPTSRAVPPSEIDIDPLAGELLTDVSGNTNQLVLRVDPRVRHCEPICFAFSLPGSSIRKAVLSAR